MNGPQSLVSIADLVTDAKWVHWVMVPKKCPNGALFPALCGTMTNGELEAEQSYRVCPDCKRIMNGGNR